MLSWPAVRPLSTYSGLSLPMGCLTVLRNTVCASFRLPAKTAYILPTANKKMRNEPNLKNTKINLKPFMAEACRNYRCFAPRKNEPNTNPIYADSNPICEKNTKIYAISNYYFSQLPYVDLCEGGTFRQKKYYFSQLFDQKKCKTNPILKTPK